MVGTETFGDAPAPGYLHQMFESQVDAAPHEPAVAYGDDVLSYMELEVKANRIANHLIGLGVGADEPVAVCVERSPALIAALLGILKAGGAYVPVDPEMPMHRVDQIMRQAGARFCLTEQRYAGLFGESVTACRLDADEAAIFRAAATRPRVTLTPQSLISVYFTSGSTGVPKGVACTHGGWSDRMEVMQRTHRIKLGETVLHKTTLSFDDAALELFWPLAFGGTVALIAPGQHRDPKAILAAAARHRTILLQVVPSMLTAILDAADADAQDLPDLRSVVSSGEALLPATVERFVASMSATLYNTWGATEVSIDSTSHTCSADDVGAGAAVCIGRPFPPHTVYVLDGDLEPVGPGESGDLFIGGSGLARCYVGDPSKTADSFLPDPWSPGGRMYRTGDRGYRDHDDNLHYLGRADHQVKIRGMRVEFGEIESVITRHPKVKEAVVDVHRSANGFTRLVAYVTLMQSGEPVEVSELRDHISSYLPHYMQPSSISFLECFPVNSNGKIDRRKLGELDLTHTFRDEDHTAPEGPVETAVAEIWSSLLDLEDPSTTQDFFHLGGQSLLAVRLVARIGQRFDVELTPKEVYENPTIASLSAQVSRLLEEKILSLSPEELDALLEGRP